LAKNQSTAVCRKCELTFALDDVEVEDIDDDEEPEPEKVKAQVVG
jgi:hypothetical protein